MRAGLRVLPCGLVDKVCSLFQAEVSFQSFEVFCKHQCSFLDVESLAIKDSKGF